MPGAGSLAKLTIQAYTDPKFGTLWDDPANPLTVGINPESYSQKLGASYTTEDAAGGTGQASSFDRDLGAQLSLTLLFDGTGAVPGASNRSVDQQLSDLWRLGIRINPAIHSPNYLKLVWGSLLFKCRLESLDIDYTLFNPDGTPLRAKVTANFSRFQENLDGRVVQALTSPDLTHKVVVGPGETLSLLRQRIYGDSAYYTKVARANGLAGFLVGGGCTILWLTMMFTSSGWAGSDEGGMLLISIVAAAAGLFAIVKGVQMFRKKSG